MNQVEQKQHSGVFRILLLLLLVLVAAPGASIGSPILVTAPFSVTITIATRQRRFVSTAYRVSHLELITNCLPRRLNFWLIYSSLDRVAKNTCPPFATKYQEKNSRNDRSQFPILARFITNFDFLRSSRNQFNLFFRFFFLLNHFQFMIYKLFLTLPPSANVEATRLGGIPD